MFYYQTNFDFSDAAKQYIKYIYRLKFEKKYQHDLELDNLILPISLPGREIIKFLSIYNLNINYQGISAFTSNSDIWFEGNPHVDVTRIEKEYAPIRSRFNILVEGNPHDAMYWWNDIQWGSDNLVKNQYMTNAGSRHESWGIQGNSPKERWEYMGNPSEKKENLLTPSSFVRTDCVHTVNVSSGPRLIISVAFDETFEDIVSRLNTAM